MASERLFHTDYFQLNDSEATKSVLTQSTDAAVSAWTVLPGQSIPPHIHPQGQDSFVILSGAGSYQIDAAGTTIPVKAGDVIVARRWEVHALFNDPSAQQEPIRLISIVSPADADRVAVP